MFGTIKVDEDGTCGVYEVGTTHLYALIMLRAAAGITFETENGAEFGNLKLILLLPFCMQWLLF